MKNLLLGWLLKPQLEISALDELICIVECVLLFMIIIPCLMMAVEAIKKKIKQRKDKKDENCK